MQCAIDNAKRKFDIDISSEIKRIKADVNIPENKYPEFWKIIKPEFRPYTLKTRKNEYDETEKYKVSKINKHLSCPMNYLCQVKITEYHSSKPTLPVSNYFVPYKLDGSRKKSKKIEKLIQDYALNFTDFILSEDSDLQDLFLLRKDFDNLVADIQRMVMPDKYIGLMAWLINRAFFVTPSMNEGNQKKMNSLLEKNKSKLLKVLYTVNPEALLKCFSKNVSN